MARDTKHLSGLGSLVKESFQILVQYTVGRLKVSFLLGVISYIILSLMEIRFKGVISVTIAVANLLPYIGPLISIVVSALIVAFQHPMNIVWVTLMNLGLQLMDSFVLSPLILGKTLGVPPVVVITAAIVGGSLFNIWGVIFAVPVAAIISMIIRKFKRV